MIRVTTPFRAAGAAFLLVAPLLARQRPASDDGDLIARARAAAGAWGDAELVVQGSGTADVYGASGAFHLALSAAGAFRSQADSPLPLWYGFDGTTVWTRDHTGLGRVLEHGDGELQKLLHWVLSGHWLDADEVVVIGQGSSRRGPTVRIGLAGTPLEMMLTLDPETALVREATQEGGIARRRWTLDEYATVAGRALPHRFTFEQEGVVETYRLDVLEAGPAPASLFAPELAPPADVVFDDARPAALDVTRTRTGHLLVDVLLEDGVEAVFLFDTGAGITVLDERLARELGLPVLGSTVATGASGSTTTTFLRGTRLVVGPATLERPVYGTLDLGFLRGAFAGADVSGIVGYDLLARAVVEVEQDPPRVSVHDPEGYELAGAAWQDLLLHENHPCVEARFEGDRSGLFRIDTGAERTVTFHAPAVARLGLLAGRELERGRSRGVGGTARDLRGELAWFELAGRRFERPEVTFSTATEGAFGDPWLDGNLGLAFLRPFRLVLDYRHDRLALAAR